ncbi:tripartite tricarboxylate transporter substrate binding protein [Bordetella bronchiseptica]|uniref:Bug family tripartite tricarboxylate transporter substrate binding protein n=1 Tax=Bordetella bronchiseptica TaxID=518 RepID=UPI0004599D2D|nr:tripartite tricarboxylate transporter substrate binding protein [Bordetella bronchiseptica]KCV67015.1 tripartite tricarboxylate transporter family receptor [Bordetella bronchiseptica 99-R-0433]
MRNSHHAVAGTPAHRRGSLPHPLRRLLLALAGLALALAGAGESASAQDFPDKPIRFIVPFSAGGSTDITARTIGDEMGKYLRQSIVVENRTGAAGSVGAAIAAKAPADGYTVLVGGVGPMMVVPELDPALPYSPRKDFDPIGQVTNNDYGWVVSADSPLESAADFIDAARARPGQLSYMTTGIGGPLHVSMESLAKKQGLQLNHIPYQGESQAVGDLLAGRLDVAVMSMTAAVPLMKAGKVRVLTLLSAGRASMAPQVPTIAQAGYPGNEVPIWLGLFVPKGTPEPVAEKLYQGMSHALRQEAVRTRMRDLGAEPVGSTRAQFQAFLDSETARWKARIADTGIRR